MIIFHIPSWYPHPKIPYAGIFIKEQITAYAQLHPEDKCYVSNFYQLRFEIPVTKPFEALSNYIAYAKQESNIEQKVFSNFIELQSKVLVGNAKLFGTDYNNQKRITEQHLLKVIEKENRKPDLIHAHVCYTGGLIAQYLSNKYSIPFVITEHSSNQTLKVAFDDYGLKAQLLQVFAQAKGIWAQSTYHKNQLALLGITGVQVIPNLVDEAVFYPLENPKENTPFTFFTLGIIIERKGIDILLNAIKVIQPTKNVMFRIGGIGPQLEQLKNFAGEIGVSNNVQWLGKLSRQEIVTEFQTCNCFVLPSKSESFGVVYVEAIACGKPIIATDCGGPADIVTKFNGLLIEKDNVTALAEAINRMIIAKTDYHSDVIRTDFMNRFSRVKIVEKIRQFYSSSIAH